MKTILEPKELSTNRYISIIREAIESNGYEVFDLADLKKGIVNYDEISVANLNWYDTVNSGSILKAVIRCAIQAYGLTKLKRYGIKIIYTLHNKQGHETKYPVLSKWLFRYMCKNSDRIVVLCNATKPFIANCLSSVKIEKKVRVMYHPSYAGVYNNNVRLLPELNYSKEIMHVLFLGLIRPYKNIELILEVAQKLKGKRIEFVIAGNSNSDTYKNKIVEIANSCGNVKCIFKFIEDDDMASYYNWSDVVILPLSLKSSLNSGSAIMAFSMKRTLIAPAIGTLQDYPQNLLYSYTYDGEEDHKTMLYDQVLCAYNDWMNDNQCLLEKGSRIFEYMQENFSKDKTAERYNSLYKELINE